MITGQKPFWGSNKTITFEDRKDYDSHTRTPYPTEAAMMAEIRALKLALFEALEELNYSDNDYFYQIHQPMEKYIDVYSSVMKELEEE